jgi:hypothetical protein
MDLLELKERLETELNKSVKFQLLELHYLPYLFGSGVLAYMILSRNVKITYDGKDNQIQCHVSLKQDKYTNAVWTLIFTGTPT